MRAHTSWCPTCWAPTKAASAARSNPMHRRGTTPVSLPPMLSYPIIVYVFPDPVCPYAKMLQLSPAMQCAMSGSPTCWKMDTCVAKCAAGATLQNEKSYVNWRSYGRRSAAFLVKKTGSMMVKLPPLPVLSVVPSAATAGVTSTTTWQLVPISRSFNGRMRTAVMTRSRPPPPPPPDDEEVEDMLLFAKRRGPT